MAIAYDNASGIAHATSVSHTATGAGLVAVVFVGSHSSSAPSGVTYGGVECTFKDGITRLLGANNWYLSVWYIASPATGAQTVAVSGTDAWTFIGVVSFTGAYQSGDPFTDYDESAPARATSIALTLTSTATDFCVDAVFSQYLDNVTPNAGQTERVDVFWDDADGNFEKRLECSTEPGAASVGMGWPIDPLWDVLYVAVSVKELVPTGGSPMWWF